MRSAWRHEPAALSDDPTAPADAWHDHLTAYLDRARAHRPPPTPTPAPPRDRDV
ncbi:hypothetical protein [Streptomyces prunicolor]